MAAWKRSNSFGASVKSHRRRRGLSQIALALEADVSARHLSFMETGRARPSANMVQRLAVVLGLSRAERDSLLLAAGYAPETEVEPIVRRQSSVASAAFAAAIALGEAETAEAAVNIAATAMSGFGIDHFISGVIRRGPTGLIVERDDPGRPAVGWLRHMSLRHHHDRDYLVGAAFARTQGFFWKDVRGEQMSRAQRRILDEARDFRIGAGFVLPVPRVDGNVRAFSSWAEDLDHHPEVRIALCLVAGGMLEALDRLGVQRTRDRPSRLRPEHRETLLRIADGGGAATGPAFSGQPAGDLVAQATAVMGARCPLAAAARAANLGLLD